MKVIVWARNMDKSFAPAAKEYAKKYSEGALICCRNPVFFRKSEFETADAIIVEPDFPEIIKAYEDKNIPVITDLSMDPPIMFKEEKVEEETGFLNELTGMSAPEIPLKPAGDDESTGEAGETGTLGDQLAGVLASLPGSGGEAAETGSKPDDAPQAKTAKKKQGKKKSK